MEIINLNDILSQNTDLTKAGSVVYDLTVKAIDADKCVNICMAEVESVPSIFLNMSIGQLIDKYGKDVVREKIKFSKVTKAQAMRLKEYFTVYNTVKTA